MIELYINGLNRYIDELLPKRNNVITEMEALAEERHFPIVGPQVGRFLYQLARLKGPSDIFEMGSGFGYSAFWFALGAPEAHIILTDHDQSNLSRAENWFEVGNLKNHFEFRQGNALNILKNTMEIFDLILIDLDKENYPEALQLALKHLRTDGLIITDNVLWHGRVFDPAAIDPATSGVRTFNQLLFETDGIFSTIIPIRDGLALTLKM